MALEKDKELKGSSRWADEFIYSFCKQKHERAKLVTTDYCNERTPPMRLGRRRRQ